MTCLLFLVSYLPYIQRADETKVLARKVSRAVGHAPPPPASPLQLILWAALVFLCWMCLS